MKNKKILYLLTIIITLFTFNLNVNAAQELTCVYRKGAGPQFIFTQDTQGNKVIYTSGVEASLDSASWIKRENYTFNMDKLDNSKDASNNFTKCPGYARLDGTILKFWENYNFLRIDQEIIDEYQEVKVLDRVKIAEPETPEEEWLNTLDSNLYTGSCKYVRTLESESEHIIQINFGKNDMLITEYDPHKKSYSAKEYAVNNVVEFNHTYSYVYVFGVDKDFTVTHFLERNNGDCPAGITVNRDSSIDTDGQTVTTTTIDTKIIAGGKNGDTYFIESVRGINPITEKSLTINGSYEPDFIKVEIENCEDLLGEDIAGYFNIVWKLIKIGIPILLIGLGVVDFVQAIFSGKDDGMKKAQTKFIKRIIIAVIIFLIPAILGILLDIANGIWGNIGSDICGIIF